MLIDKLKNYIKHHKGKRAVNLMIESVNRIGELEHNISQLQKENTHIAIEIQQDQKNTENPDLVQCSKYNLYCAIFISILLIIGLFIQWGIQC